MSKAVAIIDTDGTRREYRIPSFGEMAVAEWRDFLIPINDANDPDRLHEDLRRLTGIPLKHLRRLTVDQMDALVDAYVQLREDAAKAQQEAEGTDWTCPTEIDHNGITYTVPQSIDKEATYGQWLDLHHASGGGTIPEVTAAICACMLVPKGQEYEGYHKSLEAFDTLPVRKAMGLVAFFLTSSERLRTFFGQSLARAMMSLQQGQGQEAIPSTSDTAFGQT
jgi:hypothetical protein